jgi:hypothetical protein
LPLSSSQNSKKNEYKLDYALKKLKTTPFSMKNNALKLSYNKIWNKIFMKIILAQKKNINIMILSKK